MIKLEYTIFAKTGRMAVQVKKGQETTQLESTMKYLEGSEERGK